jgi:hypothetical protein
MDKTERQSPLPPLVLLLNNSCKTKTLRTRLIVASEKKANAMKEFW